MEKQPSQQGRGVSKKDDDHDDDVVDDDDDDDDDDDNDDDVNKDESTNTMNMMTGRHRG